MSTTFVSPVPAPIAGTTLSQTGPAISVPAGRFAGDGLWWIGIAGGTPLRSFGVCSLQRFDGVTSALPAAPACTLFELSPLPQMARAAFEQIPGGLPVQLVAVPTAGATPVSDDLLSPGDALVTAPAGSGVTAYLGFAFQDRLCRDPLSWCDAIAASGTTDPSWAQLRAALAAISGTDTLRVLDHRGQPLTNAGGVTVQIGSAPQVQVIPVADGDTAVPVGASAQAKVWFTTASSPVVAGADVNDGTVIGPLQLAAGKRLVQVTDADEWLAPVDDGVLVKRWTANNSVEPIVEGTPYFARLVEDMRLAKPGGAVELAGWTFRKGSLEDSTLEWPLIPGDDSTRLLSLVRELHNAGVPMRFLVNKFLQINGPSIDDAVWLMPLLMMATGVWAMLIGNGALATNPASIAIGMVATVGVTAAAMTPAAASLLEGFAESSQDFVAELHPIDPQLSTWTPYPASFDDNPIVTGPLSIGNVSIDDVDHVGVYHQKFVGIRRTDGSYVAYLGGIDLNSDRIDTSLHRAIHPFHDVQLRITGPAVADVLRSFEERLHHHDPGATLPVPVPSAAIPDTGHHIVQVARTYFEHGSSSTAPFAFAPNGETTPIRTLMQAIAQAKDFIYIEDQYFSPPDDYVHALLNAGDEARGVRALFVTVPYQTDQPYGWRRRADVFAALRTKWGERFKLGTPVRRFLDVTPEGLVTNLGRARLASKLTATDATAELSPVAHLPNAPFFAFVEGELVLFHAEDGAPTGEGEESVQKYEVTRTAQASGWGASRSDHDENAPVLAVRIPGIYVHAKLMIVDDVFLFAGSSNLNRRSLYHDGEMNAFVIPQHLLGDPNNPARVLRSRLMAEHIGITPEMGLSLFADPFAALPYLERSWYRGAHRVPFDFFDGAAPLGIPIKTSDSPVTALLDLALATATDLDKKNIWKAFVDPPSASAPALARTPGPEYP